MKITMMAPAELTADKANPRTISDDALSRIEGSIKEFGFVEPIIAYQSKGKTLVVVGHQRLKAAIEDGVKRVPVIVYPFKDLKRARAYNITSNRTSELSDWDFPQLKDNLESIDDGSFDVELTGFSTEEYESLVSWVKPDFDKTKEELEDVEKKFSSEVGSADLKYMVLYFHFQTEDRERYEKLKAFFSDGKARECDKDKLWAAYEAANGKT